MKRVTVFYADRIYEEGEIANFSEYPDGAFIRVRQKNGKVIWWEMRSGAPYDIKAEDLPPTIRTYMLLMQ